MWSFFLEHVLAHVGEHFFIRPRRCRGLAAWVSIRDMLWPPKNTPQVRTKLTSSVTLPALVCCCALLRTAEKPPGTARKPCIRRGPQPSTTVLHLYIHLLFTTCPWHDQNSNKIVTWIFPFIDSWVEHFGMFSFKFSRFLSIYMFRFWKIGMTSTQRTVSFAFLLFYSWVEHSGMFSHRLQMRI